jgi:hypothetical protein
MPARYLNNVQPASEGGNPLLNLLQDDIDDLQIDLNSPDDLPLLTSAFIHAETAFINATLSKTIDDPDVRDPLTIQEAKLSVYWSEWLAAIHEELESLKAKGVYEEVPELPPGRKPVGCKWVLHIKRDKDFLITRFKARLVAKGFSQIPGLDFTHTFAPTARWESIRTLLTLTALYDWELRQVDVKTAFLNGPLDEEIYMRKPDVIGTGFWRLRKGLYGLKQSGRQWYLDLNAKLSTIGFKRLQSDWSVHIRQLPSTKSISATNVDDMLIASSSKAESDAVVSDLAKHYEITDNPNVNFHLGCTIIRWRSRRTMKLHQEAFAVSILHDAGMEQCKAVHTPMNPGVRLTAEMCPKTDEERTRVRALFPYCAIVGKCMYLSVCTRPDISYTVRELARFMSNYGEAHIQAAKHLLRYIQGTRSYGLTLGQADAPYPVFRALSDSDWGMGDGRKSISGFLILLGDSVLSWSSKQQVVIALSSCEAEYLSTTHCAKDVLWFRNLFQELGFQQTLATILYCDNQGTVICTHDPHGHTKMKHIDIRAHFIRDCVNKKLIDVIYLPNHSNVADLLTKPLAKTLQQRWSTMLRLHCGQGGVLEDDPIESP